MSDLVIRDAGNVRYLCSGDFRQWLFDVLAELDTYQPLGEHTKGVLVYPTRDPQAGCTCSSTPVYCLGTFVPEEHKREVALSLKFPTSRSHWKRCLRRLRRKASVGHIIQRIPLEQLMVFVIAHEWAHLLQFTDVLTSNKELLYHQSEFVANQFALSFLRWRTTGKHALVRIS
jgi:hypothetical protein